MRVFAVYVDDRHGGGDVEVFEHSSDAITYAQDLYTHDDAEDEELNDAMRNDGWIYYKSYDCGESYVFVARREVKLRWTGKTRSGALSRR